MVHECSLPLLSVPLALLGACHCTDRANGFEDAALESEASADSPTSTTAGATSPDDASSHATGPGEGTATPPDVDGDAPRFHGVFHVLPFATPIGREVPKTGSDEVTNLEIRADGTATMTSETCSHPAGTTEVEYSWEPLPGPWIQLLPGPGEQSLRYKNLEGLESLRLVLGEDCLMTFELNGELVPWEILLPGRVCWVNRCDNPPWAVHIDYCDGEPPPCE